MRHTMKLQFLKQSNFAPAAMLLLLFIFSSAPALAELMINPTRIVFDKNQRSAQIDIVNSGTTPSTYRLSIVNRRMTESGQFLAVTEPGAGDQFAGPMLTYSPRQIVLQPGGQQLVRIAVRKPADLAPGEYRSHLSFEKVADPELVNSIESQVKPGAGEVGVKIAALIGVSLPIIVRHGQTDAGVTVSDIALVKPKTAGEPSVIELQLNRTGSRSVYGDLTATFKSAAGSEQIVARAGGVSVYTPNALRRVRLAIQTAGDASLANGSLTVTYKERTDEGGKILGESTIRIP